VLFVLIHSPLVGPSTWLPVAQELERCGTRSLVPSLLPAAAAPVPQWRRCVKIVRAATSEVSDPIVLVGHSGGGLLLPAIADAVAPEVARLIFVDSGVPAMRGVTPLATPAFLEHLRSLAVDYFEQSAPSPPDWDRVECAYLLFSDAYREQADEARDRGWRVAEISGARHLHTVVDPVAVTDALLGLAFD
jgi:pimeloyl-ACP methyl ester carboxylesterase